MKILFISPTCFPAVGGAERQLALLGSSLRNSGHEVHILTHYRAGLPRIEETPAGTVFRALPERIPPRLYAFVIVARTALWLFTRGDGYDAVHMMFLSVHAFAVSLLAPALGYRWGARMAGSGESGELEAFAPGLRRRLFIRTLNRAHWLVALSSAARREMMDAGLDADRIRVVPNAVDTAHFHCPGRGYERADRLLFVGRLDPVKNLEALLEAVADSALSSCRLSIVGDGPARPALERAIRHLGIADRVKLPGGVHDPLPLYADHDVFALPSRAEGCSNALLEAMAAAMPCVCTPVGSAPDLMQNGRNGILCTGTDAKAIREGLLRILRKTPGERKRMGAAARQTMLEQCSVPAVTTRLLRIFRGDHYESGSPANVVQSPAIEDEYGEEFVQLQNQWLHAGLHHPDSGYGPRIRRILEYLGPVPEGSRILDLGSGVGTFAIVLARRGHRATGLDISSAAVAAARENARRFDAPDARFVQADAADPSVFPPASFDIIIAADIVEHLPDDVLDNVLRNCFRWLTPGGRMVIHTFPTQFYYLISCEDAVLHRLVAPVQHMRPGTARLWIRFIHAVIVPALYWLRFGETYRERIARTAHCNPPHPEKFRDLLERTGFHVEDYRLTTEILTRLPGDEPKRPEFRDLMERVDLLKPAIVASVRKPA